MQFNDQPKIGIQNIHSALLDHHQLSLDMLRVDEIHPLISGNKWFKLKYNLLRAREEGHHTLLTFGGAFSNHIFATAAAGKEYGFKTIGIIRGEKTAPLNPTLAFAAEQGMQLEYVGREAYREKSGPAFQEALWQRYGRCYLLPEGGSNVLAVQGCMEILPQQHTYQYIACCVGTGGTLAGILEKNREQAVVLGFSALKGGGFLYEEINQLTQAHSGNIYQNYRIVEDYHFGGYAKANAELVEFINDFRKQHQVLLDPIYTGKMMYGIFDLLAKKFFPPGSRILAMHSGGLQGIKGFNERYQKKKYHIFID
jgi:1-aminocyclopropane-1-carboxylate deaminase/D-cysteine desulfhydrase-like pyridoxal-dependent ACC family enzyme